MTTQKPLDLRLITEILTLVSQREGTVLATDIEPDLHSKKGEAVAGHINSMQRADVLEAEYTKTDEGEVMGISGLKPLGSRLAELLSSEKVARRLESVVKRDIDPGQFEELVSIAEKLTTSIFDLNRKKSKEGQDKKLRKKTGSESSEDQSDLTVREAKQRLLDFVKNELAIRGQQYAGVRIPSTASSSQIILQNSNEPKVLEYINTELKRQTVNTRIDHNSDLPEIQTLSLYQLKAKADDSLADLLDGEHLDEYLREEERKLAGNLLVALNDERSRITQLIKGYIDWVTKSQGFEQGLGEGSKEQLKGADTVGASLPDPPLVPEIINNPLQLATLNSDSAHKGKDLLGFEEDVEAFASIMALKDLTPPLAIALFGQWGTGKSFFMQKLLEKVDELAEHQGFLRKADKGTGDEDGDIPEDNPFCEGICQLQFNAWSYMDTNLWASLVTQIFEGLDRYINQHSSDAEKEKEKIRRKIAKQLDVAKGQRALLAEKKIKTRQALQVLRKQVSEATTQLNGKIDEIKKASKYNALKKAIAESDVQARLQNILDQAGLDKESLSHVNPDLILKELKSVQSFAHQFLKFSWKDWLWFLGGVGLFALALFTDRFGPYLLKGLEPVGGALAVVIGALTKVRQTSAKLSPLINGVVSIKNDYDEAVRQAASAHEQEILAKRIEADQLEAELQQVTEKLRAKEAEVEALSYSTETLLARKAMYNFITDKAASTDYSKHLGIISMIRKDFQTLSHLFVESLAELKGLREKLESGEITEEELGSIEKRIEVLSKYEDFNNGFNKPLERIILYIDDLDRCPEERVVEVLEAVNLLMAFPLFVVVVGVDPRWVKNALIKKYQLQFTGRLGASETYMDTLGMEVINPSDYLEKIFQIPFHLKSPEDESIKKMISHLLGDALAKKKASTLPSEGVPADSEAPKGESKKADENIDESALPDLKDLMGEVPKVANLDVGSGTVPESASKPALKATLSQEEEMEPEEVDKTSSGPGLKKVTPKSLELHWEEGEHMKSLSWLIGNTPRTVKRFVNMYRIIRAHEGLSYENDQDKIDLLLIIFILALRTGKYAHFSDDLFEALVLTEKTTLHDCLDKAHKGGKSAKDADYNALVYTLLTDESLELVRSQPNSSLDKNITFVKRFSFKIPD